MSGRGDASSGGDRPSSPVRDGYSPRTRYCEHEGYGYGGSSSHGKCCNSDSSKEETFEDWKNDDINDHSNLQGWYKELQTIYEGLNKKAESRKPLHEKNERPSSRISHKSLQYEQLSTYNAKLERLKAAEKQEKQEKQRGTHNPAYWKDYWDKFDTY